MEFITLDMEIADRIYPALCSICLIKWKDGKIETTYSSLINPELEIEPFMEDHHHLSDSDVSSAPLLRQIAPDIINFIKQQKVFTFYGNKNIKYLLECFNHEHLRLPNFQFASVQSISNKIWPELKNKKLPDIQNHLHIKGTNHNSLSDSRALGIIINKAAEIAKVDTIDDLFHKIGFTGGFLIGNEKFLYRAIKIEKKYRTENYIYDMKLVFPNLFVENNN